MQGGRWRDVGAFCVASLPLLAHFVLWTASDYDRVQRLRRYGEDVTVAATAYLERLAPSHVPAVALSSAEGYAVYLQRYLLEEDQRFGLRPWQFWRTLPDPPTRPGLVVPRGN